MSTKYTSSVAVMLFGCFLLAACDSKKDAAESPGQPEVHPGPATRPATPEYPKDISVVVPDLSEIRSKDLPQVGEFEEFRNDQSGARALCRALGIPELPDISEIDADGQKQFHTMLLRLRDAPRDANEYGLFGQLYSAQRFPERSVRLFERAIAMDPVDYQWHYGLALRLEQDGNFERAEAAYSQAAELNPEYAPVWMRLAWRDVAEGDNEAALADIERYITLRPEDAFGYVERAEIYYDLGRWDAMQKDLEKAETLGDVGKKGHRLLGALYSHLGNEPEREFHLQMSRENLPGLEMDDPQAHIVRRLETFRHPEAMRFNSLITQGRYAEALDMREVVLEKTKNTRDYGTVLGLIAQCYRQLRQYPKAYEYAMMAVREIPDEPAPYVELALTLVRGGPDYLDAAMKAANKAVSLDQDLDTARYARGLVLLQYAERLRDVPPMEQPTPDKHPLPAAVRDLEHCAAHSPVNVNYLVALSTAYAMQRRFEEAAPLVDKALRIDPEDEAIRELKRKIEQHEAP